MANLTGRNFLNVVTTMDDINADGTTPASPETFNSRYQLLLDNDAVLKRLVENLERGIDAANLLAKLRGVDGDKSGLDADTLDGKHLSEIQDTSKRFQISSSFLGGTIGANQSKLIYSLYLSLGPQKRVYLRRVRFSLNNGAFFGRVAIGDATYTTNSNDVDTAPNTELYSGTSQHDTLNVFIVNVSGSSASVVNPVSFWLDLEIVTV